MSFKVDAYIGGFKPYMQTSSFLLILLEVTLTTWS